MSFLLNFYLGAAIVKTGIVFARNHAKIKKVPIQKATIHKEDG